jgi:hypothetical protein
MKINFIFLLGCMIACLLFLSCSVGDKSNSQVTEASALTSNVQENKSEQERNNKHAIMHPSKKIKLIFILIIFYVRQK